MRNHCGQNRANQIPNALLPLTSYCQFTAGPLNNRGSSTVCQLWYSPSFDPVIGLIALCAAALFLRGGAPASWRTNMSSTEPLGLAHVQIWKRVPSIFFCHQLAYDLECQKRRPFSISLRLPGRRHLSPLFLPSSSLLLASVYVVHSRSPFLLSFCSSISLALCFQYAISLEPSVF